MTRSILFSSILLSTISCTKDHDVSLTYPDFEKSLWISLETFEYEAQLRGIELDLNDLDLKGQIEEIAERGVAGSCYYNSQRTNEITIDESYWEKASALQREFVVFHELGHCVLNRGHREKSTANGLCVSIMQSGLGTCRLAYNRENRSVYLDELFYPNDF